MPAGALRGGERVVRLDGWTATVAALAVRPGVADYYNLTVSQLHTYAVGTGQFVVHNCGGTNDTFIGKRMQRRVNDELLNAPGERGDVPREKATDKPVEIHHVNQDPEGPFQEMTASEHRGRGNSKVNHPFLGKGYRSRIDRDLFEQQKSAYWSAEWDRGRWR